MLHLCFFKLERSETRDLIPGNLLCGDQHRSFRSLFGAFMFISSSVLIKRTSKLNVARSLQIACSSISLPCGTKLWLNRRLIIFIFSWLTLQKIVFLHKEKVPLVGLLGMIRWLVCFMFSWLLTWCWTILPSKAYDSRWIDTQICCDDMKFGHDYSQGTLLKSMWMKCSLTSHWFCLLILRKIVTTITISNIFWLRELKYYYICVVYWTDF